VCLKQGYPWVPWEFLHAPPAFVQLSGCQTNKTHRLDMWRQDCGAREADGPEGTARQTAGRIRCHLIRSVTLLQARTHQVVPPLTGGGLRFPRPLYTHMRVYRLQSVVIPFCSNSPTPY
jgi:hypothetical protein